MNASTRIGAGRNSRVFRLDLAPGGPGEPAAVVIKFYRRDPADARDRLAVEYGALEFLWRHGLRCIPRPIAFDRDAYCAVYDHLPGDVPEAASVTGADVDATIAFLATLKSLRRQPDAHLLPVASEACFSLAQLAESLEGRYRRLVAVPRDADRLELHKWLADTFVPLRAEALSWAEASRAAAGRSMASVLPPGVRTLSPSDVGFHNTLRREDGSLAFVDFEYFGWDDPAKTLVDFLLHPGMALTDAHRARFAAAFLAAFADDDDLLERARAVYPLFGLKWCLIILNEFLPERTALLSADRPSESAACDSRALQLAKADGIAHRLRREYRENPYLKS